MSFFMVLFFLFDILTRRHDFSYAVIISETVRNSCCIHIIFQFSCILSRLLCHIKLRLYCLLSYQLPYLPFLSAFLLPQVCLRKFEYFPNTGPAAGKHAGCKNHRPEKICGMIRICCACVFFKELMYYHHSR